MITQQIASFIINDSELNQIAVKQEFLPEVQHYKITFSIIRNGILFSNSELVSKESFESLNSRIWIFKRLKDSLRSYLGSTNEDGTFSEDSIFSDILCPDTVFKNPLDDNHWILTGF